MSVICELDNDEYFTISPNVDLSGGDELTLCCFAKFESLPGGPPRLICSSWDTGHSQNWALTAGDATEVHLRVATGSDTATRLEANGIITTDTWYHLAGVYDGSDMYVYLDGEQEATRSLTGNIRNVGGSTTALFTDPNQATSRNADAEMYDVRIYNRALSVQEIKKIIVTNGADNIVNGLVARWLMNEFAPGASISGSNVLRDIAGGHHGTAVNTPTGGNRNSNKRRYL